MSFWVRHLERGIYDYKDHQLQWLATIIEIIVMSEDDSKIEAYAEEMVSTFQAR